MLQKEWLSARKKLLRQIRAQIRLLLGEAAPALKEYSKNYHAEFRSRWRKSSAVDFQEELLRSRLVLGGDFHAYSQSQRLHLRILREISRPVVLGLECVESKHQKYVDLFQAGKLSEADFLRKVQWEKHWGFPWENYRPLFVWAKKAKVRVYGLNAGGAAKTLAHLKKRDAHAAKLIKKIDKENPNSLIYVIFGDLHLAKPHLPKALCSAYGKDPEPLILLQNADELYFKSAKNSSTTSEWFTSSGRRYCHLNSPPWVKWQSYLMFLEHNFDRDWEDAETGVDLTDQMATLVRLLSRDFKLAVSMDKLAVYSSGEFAVEGVLNDQVSPLELKLAKRLLQNGRSFFVPEPGLIYLSRLSINHAAGLAGQFIHSQLSGRRRTYWSSSQDFPALIWSEAVGFFFSKLINPHRKAESIKNIRARLEASEKGVLAKEALLLALDQRMRELVYVHSGRMRASRIKVRSASVRLEAARILGEMMGEGLFEKYKSKELAQRQLMMWLKVDSDAEEFKKSYLSFVRFLEDAGPELRVSRPERLEAQW